MKKQLVNCNVVVYYEEKEVVTFLFCVLAISFDAANLGHITFYTKSVFAYHILDMHRMCYLIIYSYHIMLNQGTFTFRKIGNS